MADRREQAQRAQRLEYEQRAKPGTAGSASETSESQFERKKAIFSGATAKRTPTRANTPQMPR